MIKQWWARHHCLMCELLGSDSHHTNNHPSQKDNNP